MRLSSGEVWTLPITLPVDEQKALSLKAGDTVRLTYNGETYGVIEIEDIYTPDKKTEAVNIYKTDELDIRASKNCLTAAAFMWAGRSRSLSGV